MAEDARLGGPSLAYAVSVVQGGRFYLFSGRSYAPNEVMVEYTEGTYMNQVAGNGAK